MQAQPNGVSHDASNVPPDGGLEQAKIDETAITIDGVGSPESGANGHRSPRLSLEQPPTSPRGTKRKLVHTANSEIDKIKKLPSPPWKTFEPDRPSSFVDEGKRRSGRMNAVPLAAQPQTGKRQTRAAYQHSNDGKRQGDVSPSTRRYHKSQDAHKSHVSFKKPTPKPISYTSKSTRQNASKSPSQLRKSSPVSHKRLSSDSSPSFPGLSKQITRRRRSSEVRTNAREESSADRRVTRALPPSRPVKSLRLNFRRPPMPILHPRNVLPISRYASFQECLDQNEPLAEGGEGRFTPSQVRAEALVLQRLEKAAAPGGVLNDYSWTADDVVTQSEPSRPQTHPDFLFAQFKMFLKEMRNERARHVKAARMLAHACAQAVKERWISKQPQQPKTEEQLRKEEQQRLHAMLKAVFKELGNRWAIVSNVVRQRKFALYQKEQEEMTKQALGEMLERSSKAVENRQKRGSSTFNVRGGLVEADSSLVSEDADSVQEGEYSTQDEDETATDDDSTSSDNDESEDGDPGSDDELTVEEIKQKYGPNLRPEIFAQYDGDSEFIEARSEEPERDDATDLDVKMGGIDPSKHKIEDVADELLDSEGDETDSDDGTDISDDDEPRSGSEESDGSSSISEDDQPGLLGFFSCAARKPWAEPEVTQEDSMQADHVADDTAKPEESILQDSNKVHVASEANSSSDEPSGQGTPATTVTSRHSEREAGQPAVSESKIDDESPSVEEINALDIKTKVPSLLRGQLREYQHYGLDWLAGMYASETNGILADEMGLGKTIQTIALLAHLATEKEVWGPHLVVVPTSVMLNWEMEFKKWCPGFKILTYYGTQEERKAKRKGWLDNDRWHVCITSYQLALQDQSSLKKRNWHYMVLDEAHNIKNFRSQRWQTLLSFKTRARLLLTGTPLQNNLTELWSLLFFLSPEVDEEGHSKFADLKTFSTMFRHPVEQILDHGREAMDDEARDIVNKLHQVLRPHLLRRLKSEVEKQMPKKYEHIVKCRLSKRQRQLYDGYMGLAGTRESFASGNYMSIINCLMQLRKVCNHPDLFETRQIVTSFAMPRSAIADYEVKELLVRRRTLAQNSDCSENMRLLNLWQPNKTSLEAVRTLGLAALQPLQTTIRRQNYLLNKPDNVLRGNTLKSALHGLDIEARKSRLYEAHTQLHQTALRIQHQPVYSKSLIERLTLKQAPVSSSSGSMARIIPRDWRSDLPTALQDLLSLSPGLSESTETAVAKFGCITPAVVAPNMAQLTLTENGMNLVQDMHPRHEPNPFHVSQTRLSIAFPDRSLIQYDCGKLQQLARLLRDLQAGGHRALIFTQMTKVLDILEQFMNLHGHRYLRLDGSTKVEQRQALTDQFNRDTRILAFILSSRSGGLGINLTGADTVIFYDLDWNPAMDKQCQDRCHRIGQTRDVHIYRFVSEGTIEANILRKSNQKRMLDDVVIQEGEFTTDVFNRETVDDDFSAEADAALDKVLGGGGDQMEKKPTPLALEQAEDQEDREAAIEAQKEDVHLDAVDFEGKPASAGNNTPDARFAGSPAPAPTAGQNATAEIDQTDESEPGSYEEFMLRFMEWELRDFTFNPTKRGKKKAKRGNDPGIRIRR